MGFFSPLITAAIAGVALSTLQNDREDNRKTLKNTKRDTSQTNNIDDALDHSVLSNIYSSADIAGFNKEIANKDSQTNILLTNYSLEEKIDILQRNIANIRKLSGVPTTQFAKSLEITKQALNNWETKKNKINYAQYILLVNFFYYLALQPSIKCDKTTFFIIVTIITRPELYSREELTKYQETITALANLSRNNTQVSTIIKALIKQLPSSLPWKHTNK
jgi:DNA-binding transcriptional regulator YiaG